MKAATYAKRYGGTVEQWERAIKNQATPKAVGVNADGSKICMSCGHTCRQVKKCNYCGQVLQDVPTVSKSI